MAIYTTFFLARPEALAAGFAGWKPPLPAPVRREWTNPFTKKVQVFESDAPEWDDEPTELPGPRIVAIQGRYEDYLEARLPPFVRAAPHWACKSLTQIEVEPLLVAMKLVPAWGPVLYAPPSTGAVLQALPAAFAEVVTSLDARSLAEQWAAVLSTPHFTHNAHGQRILPDFEVHHALEVLEALVALARRAEPDLRTYLLTEP